MELEEIIQKELQLKNNLEVEDLENEDITTFFDLDAKGVEFVFNLNFFRNITPITRV